VLSDAPERPCGGQAGGADRWEEPGQGADEQGGGQEAGPGFGRDDDGLAMAAGIDGGGGGAEDDAGGAADQGHQDGLGQELRADLAAGGAEHPAQPDLLAASQNRDDHDVGHPDRADQQRDRAQAKEQRVEWPLASAWAVSASEGWETVTWFGFTGLAWSPSRLSIRAVTAWVLTVRT
jgi:hypothetical protein